LSKSKHNEIKPGLGAFVPSGQKMDWTYSNAPWTCMGQLKYQKSIEIVHKVEGKGQMHPLLFDL